MELLSHIEEKRVLALQVGEEMATHSSVLA